MVISQTPTKLGLRRNEVFCFTSHFFDISNSNKTRIETIAFIVLSSYWLDLSNSNITRIETEGRIEDSLAVRDLSNSNKTRIETNCFHIIYG